MIQITIDTFLSKLVRDYPLQEEPFKGMISEWCREALKLIDNYDQWERKEIEVTVREYRTPIPADFYSFDHSEGVYDAREQGSDLYFGFRNGKIKMRYLAFPTDREGYILIPDTVEYQEALALYCVAKMCRKRIIINDREFTYDNFYQKFLDKKNEARADLHMRNEAAKERLAIEYHNILRGLEQPRARYGRR